MRLARGPDDHDVVGAVPGGHAHAPQIILEAARGDFGGEDDVALRVDITEGMRRRQRHRALEALGAVTVDEGANHLVLDPAAPDPALAPWTVVRQVA